VESHTKDHHFKRCGRGRWPNSDVVVVFVPKNTIEETFRDRWTISGCWVLKLILMLHCNNNAAALSMRYIIYNRRNV